MIRVEIRAGLRVRRGKLAVDGVEVHAATFLRERRIVLDSALLEHPGEMRRIFLHELLHFAWWRLGNARRLRWEHLLRQEVRARSRGELGWSAEIRKRRLSARDVEKRSRAWREYCCESFCDSGATIWLGDQETSGEAHEELTLGRGRRAARREWFRREDIIRDEDELAEFVEPGAGWGGILWPGGVPGMYTGEASTRRVRGEGREGAATSPRLRPEGR